ncbi:unnamed protein product, partial [Meganyctiphanes norvegica]
MLMMCKPCGASAEHIGITLLPSALARNVCGGKRAYITVTVIPLLTFALYTPYLLIFSVMACLNNEGEFLGVSPPEISLLRNTVMPVTQRTVKIKSVEEECEDLLIIYPKKDDILHTLKKYSLHVSVGQTDALRLYHVVFSAMRQYSEVRIRRCGVQKFSCAGHILAAADTNLIILTSNISFKKIITLKGHLTKVTGMGWYPDDSALMSCSSEGAVYAWDIKAGIQLWEVKSLSSATYLCGALSLDSKPTLIAGHGTLLTEVTGGQMIQDLKYSEGEMICVGISAVKTLVILGTAQGKILLNKFPLHMAENIYLASTDDPINTVVVTADEGRVVSCGSDGLVIVWRLGELQEDSPGFLAARERLEELPRAEEMLVARKDMQATQDKVEELVRSVSYLRRDKEVHLGLQQQEFHNSRDILVNRYQAIVDQMNDTIENLELEIVDLRESHVVDLERLSVDNKEVFKQQQNETRDKLLYEYSKQDKLELTLTEMQATLDK